MCGEPLHIREGARMGHPPRQAGRQRIESGGHPGVLVSLLRATTPTVRQTSAVHPWQITPGNQLLLKVASGIVFLHEVMLQPEHIASANLLVAETVGGIADEMDPETPTRRSSKRSTSTGGAMS